MNRATAAIEEFLRKAGVNYQMFPHPPAFTAQEEAAKAHVPGRDWAKVVVCFADRQPIEAVLPAPYLVDLERLRKLAHAGEIRLAKEHEFKGLFPDCEPGAMPPLGPLYRQVVFVDDRLAAEPEIVFDAGSHSQAVRMRYSDFAAVVKPIVGTFSHTPMH
jgi:Ala-tRNA(Pro) deacylase